MYILPYNILVYIYYIFEIRSWTASLFSPRTLDSCDSFLGMMEGKNAVYIEGNSNNKY